MSIGGFRKETEEKTKKDVLAIFEVSVDVMDTPYWQQLKVQLEANFRQQDLLIDTEKYRFNNAFNRF